MKKSKYMESTLFTKLLSVAELPANPYERNLRDLHFGSSINFDEWRKEYEKQAQHNHQIRNRDHPIQYNRAFVLDKYQTIFLSKRKGEDWFCYFNDSAPNGGCGNIKLDEGIKIIKTRIGLNALPENILNMI